MIDSGRLEAENAMLSMALVVMLKATERYPELAEVRRMAEDALDTLARRVQLESK